jgi:hypothetical protein
MSAHVARGVDELGKVGIRPHVPESGTLTKQKRRRQ